MAGPARSEVSVEAEMKNPLGVCEAANGIKEDDGEQVMRRRLFERFMASCGPGRPYLYEAPKVRTHPCVLYTMRVSVKNARASWSHRSSRRFFPDRLGSFPIPVCRAAGPDGQVEPVVDRSGAPVEPDRPGIVSCRFDRSYYSLVPSREKEVAVIGSMPGGRGISLTAHINHLVVRLHDILFLLPEPFATVDLRFSEQWFQLPARWMEERVYAEDGFHIVDIGLLVENLVRKLYSMRKQEDVERLGMTEEEWEMRLQEEEATRQQEEEDRRKICKRKQEDRRREAVAEAKPAVRSLVWDPALWLINDAHPAAARCYSKFKLSMDRTGKVSCNCVEQEGLQDMLWRVENNSPECVPLPVSKTAPGPAPSRAIETLGSVEGYLDLGTISLGPTRYHFIDQSGCTLSSVVMVWRGMAKVLTIKIVVRKLEILLDDGMVMSGRSDVSVDVHCDDIYSSELMKTNWAYHILCKNIDGEGITSFSALLVHLKKKLKLHLTKEEWALYNLTAVDAEEDNEDLLEPWRKMQNWVPAKPKPDVEEVELCDCSILFPTPWES